MKLCKDCDFFSEGTVEVQGRLARTYVCTNENCRDPVLGDILPAEIARKAMAGGVYTFCGVPGRFWKLKEVKKEEQPREGNVIQLAK